MMLSWMPWNHLQVSYPVLLSISAGGWTSCALQKGHTVFTKMFSDFTTILELDLNLPKQVSMFASTNRTYYVLTSTVSYCTSTDCTSHSSYSINIFHPVTALLTGLYIYSIHNQRSSHFGQNQWFCQKSHRTTAFWLSIFETASRVLTQYLRLILAQAACFSVIYCLPHTKSSQTGHMAHMEDNKST